MSIRRRVEREGERRVDTEKSARSFSQSPPTISGYGTLPQSPRTREDQNGMPPEPANRNIEERFVDTAAKGHLAGIRSAKRSRRFRHSSCCRRRLYPVGPISGADGYGAVAGARFELATFGL